jgi:hypothetical protein
MSNRENMYHNSKREDFRGKLERVASPLIQDSQVGDFVIP